MATDIDICSKSLIELGERPITSFNEDTDASRICATIYPDFATFLIAMHQWSFSKKKQQLNRLVSEPENEYRYQYQIPTDSEGILAIYDSGSDGATPVTNWEKFGDVILTNNTECWADYRYNPGEAEWPSYFIEFVVKAMAAKLALSFTDDIGLRDRLNIEAWGPKEDNMTGGLCGLAKFIDSQQDTAKGYKRNAIISARFSGAKQPV